MKSHFEIPPAPASLGGLATDLHDSVARLPAHIQAGDDSLAVLSGRASASS
jgi:hypothetical protein